MNNFSAVGACLHLEEMAVEFTERKQRVSKHRRSESKNIVAKTSKEEIKKTENVQAENSNTKANVKPQVKMNPHKEENAGSFKEPVVDSDSEETNQECLCCNSPSFIDVSQLSPLMESF